jgi:hypothetical protein
VSRFRRSRKGARPLGPISALGALIKAPVN